MFLNLQGTCFKVSALKLFYQTAHIINENVESDSTSDLDQPRLIYDMVIIVDGATPVTLQYDTREERDADFFYLVEQVHGYARPTK